jgi:hypothetical protein
VQPAAYDAAKDKTLGDTWSLTKWNKDETWPFAIEARLENETGKTIGTASVSLRNQILAAAYTQPVSDSAYCVFPNVPVDDITDRMKVSIERVNGKNITSPENADYIKVSPLEPDGFTKDGYDIAGYDKQDRDMLGYNKNGRNRKGQLGPLQRELNRIAAEKRQARSRQFAKERFAGEIWAAYGERGYGGFMGGAGFMFRLGQVNSFPWLGLTAEASFLMPLTGGNTVDKHFGGGLCLGFNLDDSSYWRVSLSLSGGVSFIDNGAVPYLHINGYFPVLGPLTGGVFFHFYPDDVDRDSVTWYIGYKIKFP